MDTISVIAIAVAFGSLLYSLWSNKGANRTARSVEMLEESHEATAGVVQRLSVVLKTSDERLSRAVGELGEDKQRIDSALSELARTIELSSAGLVERLTEVKGKLTANFESKLSQAQARLDEESSSVVQELAEVREQIEGEHKLIDVVAGQLAVANEHAQSMQSALENDLTQAPSAAAVFAKQLGIVQDLLAFIQRRVTFEEAEKENETPAVMTYGLALRQLGGLLTQVEFISDHLNQSNEALAPEVRLLHSSVQKQLAVLAELVDFLTEAEPMQGEEQVEN